MSKQDLLQGCNEHNVPVGEFISLFCCRCRNPECTRAGYSGSLWIDRISTQVERLLSNPQFADLTHPKYAQLRAIDFPDMARQALRIEVANKRGDWVVPDIEPEEAMAELIKMSAQTDAPPKPKLSIEVEDTLSDELDDPLPDEDYEEEDVTPQPEAPPVQRAPNPEGVLPQRANTPFPAGGVMLDGPVGKKPIVVDPWAVPAPPPANIVPIGAKIRMGLAAADAAVPSPKDKP